MESDEFNLRNLREWYSINDVLQKIPSKIQRGFFSQDVNLTCLDVLPEFLAFGSDVGIIFWYNRKNGKIQELRTEVSQILNKFKQVEISEQKTFLSTQK